MVMGVRVAAEAVDTEIRIAATQHVTRFNGLSIWRCSLSFTQIDYRKAR